MVLNRTKGAHAKYNQERSGDKAQVAKDLDNEVNSSLLEDWGISEGTYEFRCDQGLGIAGI